MTTIKFTATKLVNLGKKGILTPDADGYYELIIGGLNTFNSVGEYYAAQGATQLFERSSALMRRIQSGNLKGESGHPKQAPGMSMDQYVRRIMQIEESNVCCTFKEVWLDLDYGKTHPELQNPDLIAIMAKVKPSGPNGDALKASLDNPSENVCFSIRAFTKDYFQRGKTIRVLEQIVCWDNVTEPGISISNKWQAPSLEGLEDLYVSKKTIERIVQDRTGCLATEDSRMIAQEVLSLYNAPNATLPLFSQW